MFAIEAYAVPDTVPYLQVADSSVVKDMIAWVVPAAKVPDGWPELLAGGVESGISNVLPETILERAEALPESSVALIAK